MSFLVKFIISHLQNSEKNHEASRCIKRPLHQRSTPEKKFTCQNHFVEQLACTVSVKIQSSVFQFSRRCRFRQSAASISPVPSLARCSLLLLLIHRAARSPGRERASAVSWQRCIAPVRGGSSTCCGCQRGAARDGAVQHRPHHQKPTRGRLLPRACCSTVAVA